MTAATMFSFLRRKVGIKIIAGYLIVIGLMLAIGYLALLQLDRISNGLSRVTDNLSTEWALSNEISRGMEAAWFYSQAYVASHEQSDLNSFQHEIAQLQVLLQRVDALDLTPERRARFAQIAAEVEQYQLAFGRVAQLISKQDEIELQILEAKVPIIDHNLTAVRASLNTLTSPAGFLAWGNAQNAFQLLRLYTTKYLTSEDERYITSFDQAYRDMQNALTDLETALDALPAVQQVGIARTAAQDYVAGFQSLQTNIAARRQVFAEDLGVLEPRITTATDEIVAELRADLEAEEAQSRDIVTQMRFRLLVAVAALTLIGLALAVITSRNITRPLRQVMQTSQSVAAVDVATLTAQLETLSQGDVRLHLDITAQPLEVRRLDEVGNMARAFNEIIFQLRVAQRAFDRMAAYLSDMAGAAANVAQGDLSVRVAPRSTSDVLGNALHEMIANLRAAEGAMRRQFERLTALRDIDAMITSRRGLSAALFFLLGKAMQFLELEAAEIYLVTPSDPPLRRFTQLGLDLGDTSAWALRVADEEHSWVLEVPPPAEPAESRREIPALVGYGQPLVVQGQVNGVLQVFHRAPFTPPAEWTGFLEALCSQAAIAIDNDQLVRGLEDRVALRTDELIAEREALRQSHLALHRLQAQLEQMNTQLAQQVVDLEEHNYELDAFAHTVAHDLKNPLMQVIGYADTLLEYEKHLPDAERRQYLNSLSRGALKMDNIIEELLLLAGVRRGIVTPLSLEMSRIVAEAMQRLDLTLKQAQARIILPETWPSALGHAPWVEEVWANYLSNACKYGGQPPLIELGSDLPSAGTARFWVRDNGDGIAPEDQARLFVPFTRLDQARAQGHGLGLSVVRRIVEKLGGQVGVESTGQPGQGCTFYFTLPMA